MTSTVLDVTVLLLCVSASVIALGATDDGVSDRGPAADDVADRLVTETVTVTYESSTSPNGTRTVHATGAELLAILVANGRRADAGSEASGAFSIRSRATISDRLGPRTRIDVRTVTTTDENDTATTNDPVREPVSLGTNPPRNAEVTTAIVTQPVPSGSKAAGRVRIVVRRW